MPKNKKTDIVYTENLKPVLSVLDEKDAQVLIKLKEELTENWHKNQVYRTDTEARISVLNDIKHPTPAAKYWQAVREQAAMFDSAIGDAYHLRWLEIRQLKWERKLKKAIEEGNDIKQMELELKLDGNLIEKNNTSRSLKWRIQELEMWSRIKNELDDGTFNSKDSNAHKAETYKYYWSNRVKAVKPTDGPSEIINALGSYAATEKLVTKDNKVLNFKEYKETLPLNYQPKLEHLQELNKTVNDYNNEQYYPELKLKKAENTPPHPMISETGIKPPKVLRYIEPVAPPEDIKEVKNGKAGDNSKNSWY